MAWAHIANVYGTADKPYSICLQTEGAEQGKIGCSCPAWTRGAARREDCKHIRGVLMALRALLSDRQARKLRAWENAQARRVEFAASAGDLFRVMLEHGVAVFDLPELTKMAVIAETAPGLVLPVLNWRA
jgi:hypothetical protein